ncbi:hypothetical protein [Bacillus wiedmannii]|uniref:hypothetical protein n=1 Tax=Bacillus wiedmannii TaxID=1890302 RepID=UPI0015CF1579|nr:hypothetical protein [Bacillus wiedmannii]
MKSIGIGALSATVNGIVSTMLILLAVANGPVVPVAPVGPVGPVDPEATGGKAQGK